MAWIRSVFCLDPQNRARIYIVGLKSEYGKFVWPAAREPVNLKDFLDKGPKNKVEYVPRAAHKRKNVLEARAKLTSMGKNPDRVYAAVDIASSRAHVMLNMSPCLTASRGAEGGHWLMSHRRQMKVKEMLRLQGMNPQVVKQGNLSDAQMGRAIGNAMTQSVLEDMFAQILPKIGF